MNFFDDSSDDDSEWEDDNGTRNFSDMYGLESHGREEEERGRNRTSGMGETSRALPDPPHLSQIPNHSSATVTTIEASSTPIGRQPKHARQMSLRRVSKVKVVDNGGSGSTGRGTPRGSMLTDDSPIDVLPQPLTISRGLSNAEQQNKQELQTKHRRNTSESLCADSILEAHLITMQALESLMSNSPLGSQTNLVPYEKGTSFSERKHIQMMPLQTPVVNPDRLPTLPAHFIRTPYPFSAKKEFPKPKIRPRNSSTVVEPADPDNAKGKHVLGTVASDGKYDLKSRVQRNADSEGVIRWKADGGGKASQWSSVKSVDEQRGSVVWLSLRRNQHDSGVSKLLEHIVVPGSLTTTEVCRQGRKWGQREKREAVVDFDDMLLARRLEDGYKKLAGRRILGALSARSFRYIQLAQVSTWSGAQMVVLDNGTGELLAARHGPGSRDKQTPFTEHDLMHLCKHPETGKACYSWVHWARRVAALNHAKDGSSSMTTIQFVHAFSPMKVLLALALLLALSVLAALLWIFVGQSAWALSDGRARAERVGSGMLVGGMVAGVEGVVFAAWIVGSWMWL